MTDLFAIAGVEPEADQEHGRCPRPETVVRAADVEGPYRWSMTRAWGSGPTIMWVLFNPSDADGKRDDPTTLRMMGFSYRWGFGSMIVANVYPFVASQPRDLVAWRKTFDWKTYEDRGMPLWETEMDRGSWAAFLHNQRLISKMLTEDVTVVAAWGLGPTEDDLEHFLHGIGFKHDDEEFGELKISPNWHCLGTTSDGSPIHPLARGRNRVPDETQMQMWKRRPYRQRERSSCT